MGYDTYESMKDNQIIAQILDQYKGARQMFNSFALSLKKQNIRILSPQWQSRLQRSKNTPSCGSWENNPCPENILRKQNGFKIASMVIAVSGFLSHLVFWA